MEKRKTAGELSLQAARDSGYDALEIGRALTHDIQEQLEICIDKHNAIFDEDEYCVGYLISKHATLSNVMVRNFFAMLFLPKPRPNQTVFRYDKRLHKITHRLWALPNAATMAELSELSIVDPAYQSMKFWSDAFFKGWKYNKEESSIINHMPSHFFDIIRQQHGITMQSEKEYLNANRERLVKNCGNKVVPLIPDTLDPLDIAAKKIVYSDAPLCDQDFLNGFRKT